MANNYRQVDISSLWQDQLEIPTLVHKSQDNSQATICKTWTSAADSSVITSIDSNCQIGTETVASSIEIAQEQTHQLAVDSFQHTDWQVVQEQLVQTINCADRKEAWGSSSPIADERVPRFRSANVKQIKDLSLVCWEERQLQRVDAQQLMSSAHLMHISEKAHDAITNSDISTSPNHEQMAHLSNIQSLCDAQVITLQDLYDLTNSEALTHVSNAAALATSTQTHQHPFVSSTFNPQSGISTSSALSKAPNPNLDINLGSNTKSIICECPNCKDGRNTKSKIQHHKCHFPGCKEVFLKVSNLLDHLSWHTERLGLICRWKSCGKIFLQKFNLQEHLKYHTAQQLQEQNNLTNLEIVTEISNPAALLTPTQLQLQKPLVSSPLNIQDAISKSSSLEKSPDHSAMKVGSDSEWIFCDCSNCRNGRNTISMIQEHTCHYPDCKKVFLKVSNLRDHLRWHIGRCLFICRWKSCGKVFKRKYSLKMHIKRHTGERIFKCTICSKEFTRQSKLSIHLKSIHN